MLKLLGIPLVWILLSGSVIAPIGFLGAFGIGGGQIGTQTIATTVSSSINPAVFGQSVTFTTSISPNTATGTVQFNDTSTSPPTILGTGTITSGHAIVTTSSLSVGSHNIVAKYLGDTNNIASVSSALTQAVNKISTTILSLSAASITLGQSVTFIVSVSPPDATSSVQFQVNGTNFGSPVALSGGEAAFTTSSLPLGTDNVSVSYSGGTTAGPSTSNSITITVSSTAQGTTNTHDGENDDQENDDNENDHQKNTSDDSNNLQNNSDYDGDGKQKEKHQHQHEGEDN